MRAGEIARVHELMHVEVGPVVVEAVLTTVGQQEGPTFGTAPPEGSYLVPDLYRISGDLQISFLLWNWKPDLEIIQNSNASIKHWWCNVAKDVISSSNPSQRRCPLSRATFGSAACQPNPAC